jgi:hypothetical protein
VAIDCSLAASNRLTRREYTLFPMSTQRQTRFSTRLAAANAAADADEATLPTPIPEESTSPAAQNPMRGGRARSARGKNVATATPQLTMTTATTPQTPAMTAETPVAAPRRTRKHKRSLEASAEPKESNLLTIPKQKRSKVDSLVLYMTDTDSCYHIRFLLIYRSKIVTRKMMSKVEHPSLCPPTQAQMSLPRCVFYLLHISSSAHFVLLLLWLI